jgi:type II secretory pathway pseudopilin PulG
METVNTRKQHYGFSIVEMLVAFALAGALLIALFGILFLIRENQFTAINSYFKAEDANAAVSVFVRSVRKAMASETGAYFLSTAGTQEITFYSDIDADNRIERVRYFLNGTVFKQGIIEPTGIPVTYPVENEILKTISDNVRNGTTPVFTYYNASWPEDTTNNPLPQPVNVSDIQLIKIYLKLNTVEESSKDYILESYARIRMK